MHKALSFRSSLSSQAPLILFFEGQEVIAVVGGSVFEVLQDPGEGFRVAGEPFADGLHEVSGRARWDERLFVVLENFYAIIDM